MRPARKGAATAAPRPTKPRALKGKRPDVSYDTTRPPFVPASITEIEYAGIQAAYDALNAQLFGGSLPPVLITFQRHAKAYGYFHADRFASRDNGAIKSIMGEQTAHELALNPDHFQRPELETLSTLAHEMAHVWQQCHGTPPRRSYHDREWANKMIEIGLHPSDTHAPGGKETGQAVGHFVIPGGRFDAAAAAILDDGFAMRWMSRSEDAAAAKTKAASKTKYTCGTCGANAWAKPESRLICGCQDEGENCERMEAEA